MLLQLGKLQRPDPLAAQLRDQQKNPQDKTKVADAVDDEGLVAGDGVVGILVPKADQKIGAEADTLPADEQQQQVVGHDQHEHEEDKEIQIDEKTRHPFVVSHIAEGVDMNQKADARDNQQHDRSQRIDLQGEIYLEGTRLDPVIDDIAENSRRRQLKENVQRDGERRADGRAPQHRGIFSSQRLAEKYVDHAAEQRDQRNPAQQIVGRYARFGSYHLSSCISWGSRLCRWRNTEIMIASPMTASAAATAITKNTAT